MFLFPPLQVFFLAIPFIYSVISLSHPFPNHCPFCQYFSSSLFLLNSSLLLSFPLSPVICWLLFPSTPLSAKAMPAHASRSGHCLTPAAQKLSCLRWAQMWRWCPVAPEPAGCKFLLALCAYASVNLAVCVCVCVCPLLLLALICV